MTETELLLLAVGFNLGVLTMLAVHLVGQAVDAHRSMAAADARLASARKSLATTDWRDALTARVKA